MDPGCANLAGRETPDFERVKADSPAADADEDIADNTLDFFNRLRSIGHAADIGALESGSTQAECLPRFPHASMRSGATAGSGSSDSGPLIPPARRRTVSPPRKSLRLGVAWIQAIQDIRRYV